MSEKNNVLVVDSHLDMLDFLRSILELTVENCHVVGVTKAGEGAEALKNDSFKLMIADMGLPGVAGSGLVHHARRLWPEMQVILISDDDSESNRADAESLEVFRYYSKPLDSDDLIYSVYQVLHDPAASESEGQRTKLPRIEKKVKEASPELQARLEALRVDTGARQALLANLSGDVLIATERTGEIDLLEKVDSVADNVRASVQLGLKLGNKNPYSIQYLSGEEYEVYTANLKPDHWIALLFEIQEQRGKMGTIWFFTQKAIPDLEILINQIAAGGKSSGASEEESDTPDVSGSVTDELPGGDSEITTMKREDLQSDQRMVEGSVNYSEQDVDPDLEIDVVETFIREKPAEAEQDEADQAEESDFELADHLVEVGDVDLEEKDDLDLFWEDALSGHPAGEGDMDGVSYEEALRLGFIPGEVDLPEDQE